VPALLFAAPLAAHPLAAALDRLPGRLGVPALALAVAALAAPGWLPPERRGDWAERVREPAALRIGLDERQEAGARRLREHTTPAAGVLWEDRHAGRLEPRWTPLLPLLTERSFIGGLDADAGIEHTACGLTEGTLAGRPLEDWKNEDLTRYCKRYNVGWVV